MNSKGNLVQKTAVRYKKTGPAVYHSHHDMIRLWERAVKRARLPMRMTQGFNPRPRLVFPHALGLGVASLCEEVELEFCEPVETGDLLARLDAALAGALELDGAEALPPVKKGRALVGTEYRITGWPAAVAGRLPGIAAELNAMQSIPVERGEPGKTRSVDIRPYLASVRAGGGDDGGEDVLAFSLVHTTTGGGRADEVAKLAAGAVGVDWRDLIIVKTGMTLSTDSNIFA